MLDKHRTLYRRADIIPLDKTSEINSHLRPWIRFYQTERSKRLASQQNSNADVTGYSKIPRLLRFHGNGQQMAPVYGYV